MLLTVAGFPAGAASVELELSAAGVADSLLLESFEEEEELELPLDPDA